MSRKLVALSAIAAFSAAAHFASAGPPPQALQDIGPAATLELRSRMHALVARPGSGCRRLPCEYLYAMHHIALADSQVIVLMPDGSAAVLTITWRA